MIHTIVNTINNAITTASNIEDIADRVGGLVFPVSQEVRDQSGSLQRFTFPITHDASGKKCIEEGRHFDMVPNDYYKAVSYWEDRGGVRFVGWTQKRRIQYRADLRFVMWLNLSKFGQSDMTVTDRIVGKLVQIFTPKAGAGFQVTESGWTGARVFIPDSSITLVRRAENIFSPYSYAEFQHFLIWPFYAFAIDLQAWIEFGLECFTEVQSEDEILCLTYNNELDPIDGVVWGRPGEGDVWGNPDTGEVIGS